MYFVNLGTMPYTDALALQLKAHEACVAGHLSGVILAVEHPPVLTLGKNSKMEFIKASPENLTSCGVTVERIERGGEVTAHMPGQLVIYPILDLRTVKLSVRSFVTALETSVIQTLGSWGLNCVTDDHYPGVWCDDRKVCAIGIRIKSHASLHGLALNVCNDLALFDMITPCGINDRSVTTMTHELKRPIATAEVLPKLAQNLAKYLGVTSLETVSIHDLL